jgi:zinc transporter
MSEEGLIRHDVSLPAGGRWLDLNLGHPDLGSFLDDLIPDWALLKSNFLAEGAPVGYFEHGEGIFMAFRGADLNPGGVPENLIAVRAWCSKTLVVTASRRATRSIQDLVDRVAAGVDPGDGPSLLFGIAKRLAFHLAPLEKEFEVELDAFEDALLAGHDDESRHSDRELARLRRAVLVLRRRVLAVRRGILPQVDLLDDLEEDWPGPIFESDHASLIQEARQRFLRHQEDLDAKRDRTMLLAEEVSGLQEERTNRRTYLFTVVAGVFLPLGFVTGLLGINVGGIPGADNPLAFLWVTFGLLALGAGLWLRLRRTG